MNLRNSDKVFINGSIRVPFVLCIDDSNTNIGVIPTHQALSMARNAGLDLVQINPPTKDKPPTCKILDYGKYKYDLSKKQKESAKKQRESIVKEKEIWLRPTTDSHDVITKAKKAKEILIEGNKLKVKIKFNGRELDHKDIAMNTLSLFVESMKDSKLESAPFMEGKLLTASIVLK